jgi:hypothetical protein
MDGYRIGERKKEVSGAKLSDNPRISFRYFLSVTMCHCSMAAFHSDSLKKIGLFYYHTGRKCTNRGNHDMFPAHARYPAEGRNVKPGQEYLNQMFYDIQALQCFGYMTFMCNRRPVRSYSH